MLSTKFAQLRVTARCFSRSNIIRDINKDNIPAQKSSETTTGTEGVLGSRMYRVTDFDKKILVWVKRYPSVADVPKDVTTECILTARSKARIKTCNYMIAATILGCIIFITLGKRGAAKGETLHKQRDDWLKEQLEQDRKLKNIK
ncbi:PREDICTED: UPF0389 protein CG9231 [Vollenhovia emeryi]|uniref:UPF0389 protein CG9231 n=1 Tax=Vollenhovia emeryi TaxID=411798 RepID=UPI0005F40770|nr:PREDICTED: UPF0389 protein CG9231 [Vollenhovia emeryi]